MALDQKPRRAKPAPRRIPVKPKLSVGKDNLAADIAHAAVTIAALLPLLALASRDLPEWLTGTSTLTTLTQLPWRRLVLFLAVMAAGVAYFVVKGHRRGLAICVWILLLGWLQVTYGAVGWMNVMVVGTSLVAFALLVKALRDNLATIRKALRAQPKRRKAILGKTVVLWFPAGVAAALGLWMSSAINHATVELIYDLTPIDRYCLAPNDAGPIPCDEIPLSLSHTQWNEAVPSANEAIDLYVRERFQLQQTEYLHAINKLDADAWSDVNLNSTIDSLRPYTRGADVLGSRRLWEQAHVQPYRPQGPGIPVSPRPLTPALQAIEDAALAKARMEAGMQLALKIKDPDARAQLLRLWIIERFSKNIPPDRLLDVVRAEKEEGARHAAHIGFVLGNYDQLQTDVLKGVQLAIQEHEKTLQLKGLPITTIKDLDRSLNDLRHTYCSFERDSSKLYTDDSYSRPARINSARFRCETTAAVFNDSLALSPLPLAESIHLSITAWSNKRRQALDAAFRHTLAGIAASAVGAKKGAFALLDAIPPKINLGRESCKAHVFPPSHCIRNYLKKRMERVYASTRNEAAQAYTAEVNTGTSQGEAEGIQSVVASQPRAVEYLATVEQELHRSTNALLECLAMFSIFSGFMLGLALLKSMLYVLAQVIFDHAKSGGVGSFELGTASRPAEPHRRAFSFQLTDFNGRLISRSVEVNQERYFGFIKSPFNAIVSRLRHGWYFGLNEGRAAPGADIVVTVTDGRELVMWDIHPGSEIGFHYKYLHAYTDNVIFKSTFSLSLSNILIGRIVVHTAGTSRGIAKIFLAVKTVRDGGEKVQYLDPAHLAAWDASIPFAVFSALNWKSVYIDGFLLKCDGDGRSPKGLIVAEKVEVADNPVWKLWRQMRALFLPI